MITDKIKGAESEAHEIVCRIESQNKTRKLVSKLVL